MLAVILETDISVANLNLHRWTLKNKNFKVPHQDYILKKTSSLCSKMFVERNRYPTAALPPNEIVMSHRLGEALAACSTYLWYFCAPNDILQVTKRRHSVDFTRRARHAESLLQSRSNQWPKKAVCAIKRNLINKSAIKKAATLVTVEELASSRRAGKIAPSRWISLANPCNNNIHWNRFIAQYTSQLQLNCV